MYIRQTKILLIFIDAAATWTHAIQMTRFTLMQMSARCCKFQSLAYQEKSCWRAQKIEINNCIWLQYNCRGVIPCKLLLNFYFCFVVIFVAFSQVDAFLLTAVSVCIRLFDTNNSTQSLTRKYVYCNWKYNLCVFWSFRYTPGQKRNKIK